MIEAAAGTLGRGLPWERRLADRRHGRLRVDRCRTSCLAVTVEAAPWLAPFSVTARRRMLGDEHPDTLLAIDNLAFTLRDLGDVAGARKLQEELLGVRRRTLGDEHPDTVVAMSNLAALHDESDPAEMPGAEKPLVADEPERRDDGPA